MFKPTVAKVIVTLVLTVVGSISGLVTYGPFEGSVRDGSGERYLGRHVIRAVTMVGPAVEFERSLSNNLSKWSSGAILAALMVTYYYVVICLLFFVVGKLRA